MARFSVLVIFLSLRSCSSDRREYGRFLSLLHKKFWEPSLFQEVPCLSGEVQTVHLQAGRAWRFKSPDFPSLDGYPRNQKCTWKFVAADKSIGDMKITCDHFDVAGNFFNGCQDADYLSVQMVDDQWDDNDDDVINRICGDLTSWSPLSISWSGQKTGNTRTAKGSRSDTRHVMVRFYSDHSMSASGFSCRIIGMATNETTPSTTTTTTTQSPTTTHSTTTITSTASTTSSPPDGCPVPDDSMCQCGRVKSNLPWRDIKERGIDPTRIIGGQEATPHKYPWQVGLSYYGYVYCGGSLITRKHVMTAAHCISFLEGVDFAEEDFKIILGDHDIYSDADCSYQVGVKAIYNHPDYGKVNDFDMDFGIIELKDEIACSDNVGPVCLPEDPNESYANRNAIVTGWGTLDPDTGETPTVLYEVGVQTISLDECKYKNNYDSELITENMICAGEVGKDSCWGDSGGPMVTLDYAGDPKYRLIGVVSWGYGCALEGYPGVYARTTSVLDWIRNCTRI